MPFITTQLKKIPNPLLINSKGIKKKEGRKDGKRLKSWVEKQPKKRGKNTTSLNKNEVYNLHSFQHLHVLIVTIFNFFSQISNTSMQLGKQTTQLSTSTSFN